MSTTSDGLDQLLRQQSMANQAQMDALRQTLAAERSRLDQIHRNIALVEHQLGSQRSLVTQLEGALKQVDQVAALLTETLQQGVRAIEKEAAERQRARRVRIQELAGLVRDRLTKLDAATKQIGTLAPVPGPASPSSGCAPPGGELSSLRDFSGGTGNSAGNSAHFSAVNFATEQKNPATNSTPSRPESQLESQLAAQPEPQPEPRPESQPGGAQAQVEAGLRSRISSNVMRLLDGKIVGEDLRSADGTVIAARGTPITPDLAARAEAGGLLPGLILHMAWPEEVRR